MTKGQEVYERIEAMVASGTPKAEAFRALAEEYEQPFNSLRGSYYAYSKTLGGEGAKSSPRAKKAPQDPIEAAVAVLRTALENVDAEIEVAKQQADEAKATYDQLRTTAKDRKANIEAKIDALSS